MAFSTETVLSGTKTRMGWPAERMAYAAGVAFMAFSNRFENENKLNTEKKY
jgi:hypothetical protein